MGLWLGVLSGLEILSDHVYTTFSLGGSQAMGVGASRFRLRGGPLGWSLGSISVDRLTECIVAEGWKATTVSGWIYWRIKMQKS